VEMRGIVTALNLEKGIATLRHVVHDELFAPAPNRDQDASNSSEFSTAWPRSRPGKANAM
jgi:hypothetical protein